MKEDKDKPKANMLVDRDIQTIERDSYEYKSSDGKRKRTE